MFSNVTSSESTEGYGVEAFYPLQIDDDTHLAWDGITRAGIELCQSSASRSAVVSASMWSTLASFYSDSSDLIAADYEQRLARVQSLYEPASDDSENSLGARPTEAASEARAFIPALQSDRNLMQSAINRLNPSVDASEQVPASIADITRDIARLGAIESSATTLIAQAQEKATLAQRTLNEAELRYNQALQAANRQDFDSARDNLQRARTRFNESLALQESAALRANTDSRLADLGERIANEENELIVREVRDLKTQARTAYYNGEFENAESLLTRAQSRWRVTNVEDDVEIRNLLALVGTAISMKTGRVIPVTAPLYPEMSQILNISQQYYNQGAQLIQQGRRDEAMEILNLAKQKLNELQLVYRFNQEASLLKLRIDRLVDPRAFETQFANRVATARTEYRSLDTRQQAYTDLLDLYEINSSYPGLRNLIIEVEIEIGIRPRPIDQAALNRSASLTAQAQRLLETSGQNEVVLQQALTLVEQAIELNNNNNQAIVLKDRILSMRGGQAATVLSGQDEASYQRAIQELQRGNIIEAKTIVEQLLLNATNKRSFKVLELQKKVDSLL
jgi:outer membrane protein assembly factor BamD (BamD/ComL family)